jgi:circadian clock protein KaiC
MVVDQKTPLNRIPTGIVGLDEVMSGGLPRAGITVVIGGAGSGKTTLGLQVLANGARRGEPGIVVAFEESSDRIRANAASYAWGNELVAGGPVHVMDAQLSQAVEPGGAFDLVGFLAILGAKVKEWGARCVVFDGLDVLLGYLGSTTLIRREVFRLRSWVHETGVSAILTAKGDAAGAHPAEDYEFLQFIADCVVAMHHRTVAGTALRSLRVMKYRGAHHSSNELPLTISQAGLEVAANMSGARSYAVSTERVSTGVARLDAMLSGGYHRGSSVLITGAPGTAKTSLGAAFAAGAALRGERTTIVSFDEAAEQIVRNVASIGIQLGPHVAAGKIQIHSLRARSESPESHIAQIRSLLQDPEIRNVVVDPLSAMTQRGCEGEAEAAALQLLDFAKSKGLTIVSTSLLGNLAPLVEHSPFRISTIADTWMHVSYEIRGGERNRALTVIKSRGTAHSNQVRELVLSTEGVTLADVYSVGGEVLMGTLRWERENEERRVRSLALGTAMLRERRAELLLAGTKAKLDALARELAIQEAELEQMRLDATTETVHRVGEDDGLLHRRRADAVTDTVPAGAGTP